MKQIIVLAVLCVIVSVQALTDEQKAKLKVVSDKCIASSGADPSSVEKGRKGEFGDDPKLKEFIFCLLKATEMLDDNADVRLDKIKAKISKDLTEAEIDTLLGKCKPTATVPVEKAAEFWKCYWANTPKRIELV
uniref:Odorant binding protein 9 n=1 Tax=Anomala corpulenta TaxID=931571 RepID=A0A0E3Y6X8_9SCAR|nr:odorant binding protein 9 [Anomala corpulenta]